MPGIVIFEDDAPMRSLLAEWLAADGYRVREADAIADVDCADGADLVIVDVCLPRHLATAQQLRAARTAYASAPIVAISGHFRPGVRCAGSAAKALGVDRVIAKPFSREAFLDVVRSLVPPADDRFER